jgi:hypothetical protein
MRELGATAEQVKQFVNATTPKHMEVLESNWPALEWFFDISDLFKWQEGVCLGLDITAVKADVELSQRSTTPENYAKLREIGRIVTSYYNKGNNNGA